MYARGTQTDATMDKSAVMKSSFCLYAAFTRDFLAFSPNLLDLFSLQTRLLVEQMKHSSDIVVTRY